MITHINKLNDATQRAAELDNNLNDAQEVVKEEKEILQETSNIETEIAQIRQMVESVLNSPSVNLEDEDKIAQNLNHLLQTTKTWFVNFTKINKGLDLVIEKEQARVENTVETVSNFFANIAMQLDLAIKVAEKRALEDKSIRKLPMGIIFDKDHTFSLLTTIMKNLVKMEATFKDMLDKVQENDMKFFEALSRKEMWHDLYKNGVKDVSLKNENLISLINQRNDLIASFKTLLVDLKKNFVAVRNSINSADRSLGEMFREVFELEKQLNDTINKLQKRIGISNEIVIYSSYIKFANFEKLKDERKNLAVLEELLKRLDSFEIEALEGIKNLDQINKMKYNIQFLKEKEKELVGVEKEVEDYRKVVTKELLKANNGVRLVKFAGKFVVHTSLYAASLGTVPLAKLLAKKKELANHIKYMKKTLEDENIGLVRYIRERGAKFKEEILLFLSAIWNKFRQSLRGENVNIFKKFISMILDTLKLGKDFVLDNIQALRSDVEKKWKTVQDAASSWKYGEQAVFVSLFGLFITGSLLTLRVGGSVLS